MSTHRAIPIRNHPNWLIQQLYSEEEQRQTAQLIREAREQRRAQLNDLFRRYAYWSAIQDEYIFADVYSYNMMHSQHVKVMEA